MILWLACATPPPPPPPPPPQPPPTDEERCATGDRATCAQLRARADADRAVAPERAAERYAALCAVAPADVACLLAPRVRGYADPRAACAGLRAPAACAAAPLDGDGEGLRIRAVAMLAGALPGSAADAAVLLWRSCEDHHHGAACLALAELGARGEPLPPGTRGDVAWLRDQACDLQLAYACAPHRW